MTTPRNLHKDTSDGANRPCPDRAVGMRTTGAQAQLGNASQDDKSQRFAWLRAASMKNIGHRDAVGDLFAHPLRAAATRKAHRDAFALLSLCVEPDQPRHLFDRILDSQSTCMALLDTAGSLRMINASMRDLLALGDGDAVISKPVQTFHADTMFRAQVSKAIEEAAKGKLAQFDIDLGPDGSESRLIDVQVAPVFGASSEIVALAMSCMDATAYRDTEREILQKLLRADVALHAGQTGVWVLDLATGERSWDPRMLELFGFGENDQINAEEIASRIIPEDRDAHLKSITDALDPSGRGEIDTELRINPAPGVQRWVASRGRVIFEHGKPRLIIGTAIDITLAKDHDARIHFLMREVVHRSKNLLAVIQAMARQTAATGGTAREFEERFTARLQALAASHDLLVRDDWRGASARELVRSQLGHFAELIGSRIGIKGPDVILRPEAAQNIGLALHELATNAAKYGALTDEGGVIQVEWRIESGDGDQRFSISWIECGGPTVVAPNREGFGHRVMKRITAHALEGEVLLIFPPTGLEWHLSIPVHHLIGHGGTRPIDPRLAAAEAIRNL